MIFDLNYLSFYRREILKYSLILFLISLFSLSAFSVEKHFDRNQLPQLSEEILDKSEFSYKKELVKTDSIIPVQTQRVKAFQLTAKYKMILLNNEYDPLIIDNNNYLIDGHHRLDGIKELDLKEVRVLRVTASIEEVIEAFDKYRDFTPTYEPDNK